MYGSDTILPLERLQSTVHCIQPSRASPTDGSPSNLPLERLQSAGDESLERFQPLFFTGVTPVRLLDTTDTMCSKKSVSPTLQCERAKTRHTRPFFRQAGRA